MADKNDTMSSMVLLLKSKNEDDMYEKLLREHGYEPVFIPVLSFEFTNKVELMARLENPDIHGGLIFTSQRAVDAVCHCITDAKLERKWRISLREKWMKLPVFVTGKATANRVRERIKLSEIHGEASGNAESLASIILQKLPRDFSKALLFPCANIKKETLPGILEKEGYCLHCVTAYCTRADRNLVASLEGRFGKGRDVEEAPSGIVFFSPSGVTFSCDALKQTIPSFHKIKFIAIGQATSQGLQDHGLLVSGVALKPNPPSLVKVIDCCLKEHN